MAYGTISANSLSRCLLPCDDRGEDIFITDTDRDRFVDALADICEIFQLQHRR